MVARRDKHEYGPISSVIEPVLFWLAAVVCAAIVAVVVIGVFRWLK